MTSWSSRSCFRPGWAMLGAVLIMSIGSIYAARLEREDLLVYHPTPDRVSTVRTTAEWGQRRAEILTGMEAVMGPLPGSDRRVPLDVRQVSETDCGAYIRREITYAAEPGARVPAFLLLPKTMLDGRAVCPGVLALMPTSNDPDVGYRAVVGLAAGKAKPGHNYGEELAMRGYVVIAPPYPLLAGYQPDLKTPGYKSGTMKAIWDNTRALDVLAVTPGVDRTGFGAIGHSLGGHNAIFTAVFDERISAVVSNCGFDSFLDYKDETLWRVEQGWAQTRYMPRILNYSRPEIPFDFHELIGALAPRAFMAIAPLRDSNFRSASVDRVIAAARPVYALYGKPTQIAVEHPDCEHDFPPEMREKAYQWLDRFLRPAPTP